MREGAFCVPASSCGISQISFVFGARWNKSKKSRISSHGPSHGIYSSLMIALRLIFLFTRLQSLRPLFHDSFPSARTASGHSQLHCTSSKVHHSLRIYGDNRELDKFQTASFLLPTFLQQELRSNTELLIYSILHGDRNYAFIYQESWYR